MKGPAAMEAAEILWLARLESRRLAELPVHCRPASLDEGYVVQDAMTVLARQPAFGWKIAATSAAGQRHIGVSEPLAGRLFADFVLNDGAVLSAGPMLMRVAEAEFAFRLGRDLPSRSDAYQVGEVMKAVAGLHLAIEVPDARFEHFAKVGPAQIAADDAFAAWFVLGPEVADWPRIDLPRQPVRMMRNGAIAGEGHGADALGDPRIALTWLANERSKRGGGLKAGEIVTTGTCLTPVAVASGDRLIADFPGLGKVSVAFD
ncbi:MAG TPA: fumarylacetoacetate hydrolase family protein [Candidatus Udaeobacter sp.]|nr:fumarylacetoacetate hydrolase family protein [Candidatus Udaeobacter sp.]